MSEDILCHDCRDTGWDEDRAGRSPCTCVSETEPFEILCKTIEVLWQIIDDIDTYGDMVKSNDAAFRKLVEAKQKTRWQTGITTDGYSLDLDGLWIKEQPK